MLKRIFKKRPKLNPQIVKEYYDEWTPKYQNSFGDFFQSKQTSDPNTLTNYYIQEIGLRDNMKVLDAGCGIGGPAIYFANRLNVNIDAITISSNQIKIAEEKLATQNLIGTISFHIIDFHNMTAFFEESSFDVIYFMESLVHSENPRLAIQQAFKLLKPDGVIYIKDLYEKTAYSKNEEYQIKYWVNHNNENIKLNIIRKEDLLILLRNQGFQLEFCQLMKIPTNQDLGNKFVVEYGIMPDPIKNSLPPYLEWYEIKAIKPGVQLINKM